MPHKALGRKSGAAVISCPPGEGSGLSSVSLAGSSQSCNLCRFIGKSSFCLLSSSLELQRQQQACVSESLVAESIYT